MPFTPFHMGPGLLIKALLQGSFSLMVFGWTQIVMDLQPLIAMVTGTGQLHGFTHTLIGATLIGIVGAITGKYAAVFGLQFLNLKQFLPVAWITAFVSAILGAYTHVLLDGIMHGDLQPFAPFAVDNPLLGLISISALHRFCLYSGAIGAVLYFAIASWKSKQRNF